jgi:hypothetical protein
LAAAFVAGIPFDLSGSLAEAKRLGIVSRTILAGYPKSRDVLSYAALILLPVACSLGAWLVWSKGRRPALAALLLGEPAAPAASTLGRRLAVSAILLAFLLATFNINDFYSPIAGWAFLGEEGEYLAWAQVLLDGGAYARDFFATRGPLVVYPLAWAMKLFGASVAVGRFYAYGLNLISAVILMLLLYRTIRNRTIFILSSVIALEMFSGGGGRVEAGMLRVFLGFVPLLILYRHAGSNRKLPALTAGAALALSLLYSQEAGICAVFATGVFLCLEARSTGAYRRQARQGGLVAAGCCMALAPILGYFYRVHALGRFLENLYGLPKLMTLGYASLPFPSFAGFLAAPLAGGAYLPYWIIGIYLLAGISSLVLLFLGPGNRDLHFRVSLLVFGLFLFRAALGRSDESHFYFALPPAFLLVILMLDDAVREMAGSPLKTLKTGRLALAAALLASLLLLFGNSRALHGRVFTIFDGLREFGSKFTVEEAGVKLPQLRRGGVFFDPKTAEDLVKIGKALDRCTREGEYVLFFPNEAAYYFLFNRRVPTRYVHAYFAASAAQRREMVADLELRRPACVVYSLDDWRIDDIPEYLQVPEVVSYLQEKYTVAEDLGNILILRRKGG